MTQRPLLPAMFLLMGLALAGCQQATQDTSAAESAQAPIAIVIHGGAGTVTRELMTPEKEATIRAALTAALEAGYARLASGESSLEAITAAIHILEDTPEFNAGRGAVLNFDGMIEHDASIMDGATGQAGAIAGVSVENGGLRHPIDAARAVMMHSPHVMLSGAGAKTFAESQGLEFMAADWFFTDDVYQRWQDAQNAQTSNAESQDTRWYSTVGAVALDKQGNLAAGTSTGGMTNKRWGRIGDSPIIGAGTYANNDSCAVSATGHGEYFIRHVVAYDICARMAYQGKRLTDAADEVINQILLEAGGAGGVIAMDPRGNIAMPFNTPGMYRGFIDTNGQITIAIYGDE